MENYFKAQGIDLNEKVTVYDGVISVYGVTALTIPWDQYFTVAEIFEPLNKLGITRLNKYYIKNKRPIDLGATVEIG